MKPWNEIWKHYTYFNYESNEKVLVHLDATIESADLVFEKFFGKHPKKLSGISCVIRFATEQEVSEVLLVKEILKELEAEK